MCCPKSQNNTWRVPVLPNRTLENLEILFLSGWRFALKQNLPPPRQPHSGRLARLKVLADAHKQPDGSHGRHMVMLPQGPICLHSPRSPLGSFRDTRTHSRDRQPATAGACSRGNLLCGRGSCRSFLVEQRCDIVVDERAERFPTKMIGQLFVTPVSFGWGGDAALWRDLS